MKNEGNPNRNADTSLKDMILTSKWVLSTIFQIVPRAAAINMFTRTLRESRDLLNFFIFTSILDQLIAVVQRGGTSISEIYPWIAFMFVTNIVTTIIGFTQNITMGIITTTARPKLRERLYKKLYSLGIQTLEVPEVNNKLHRSTDNLEDVIPYYQNLSQLVANFVKIVASAVIVFTFNPYIILLYILIKIPFFFFDKKYRGLMWQFIRDTTEASRIASNNYFSLSTAKELQEITINGAFQFLSDKYVKFIDWFISKRLDIRFKWIGGLYTFEIPTSIISYFGYISVFASFLANKVTIGTVTYQIRTINNLSEYMDAFMEIFNELNGFTYQLKDTYTIFNTEPAFSDGFIAMPTLLEGPEIDFNNVTFKYPSSKTNIYENLNLRINKGEKIAIVGHNGAGKTTLVRLLSRFYQVNEGEILINKVNINDYEIDSLYKNIGVLLQEYNIYRQLSVRENIIAGNPNVKLDEQRILDAAKNADALGFIEELPNKFDQILNETLKDGVRLSTGQWQKLAIARFFYRNAPLVIFDEPTAAIDAVSEYNIFNKIYRFFEGKTVIIISHRFSTVRNADRIIVVEHGNIVEEGSHNALMEKNGTYANAFKLQAKGYQK